MSLVSPARDGAISHGERPGLPEVGIGLATMLVAGLGGGALLAQIGLAPVLLGLIFTALSGIGGLIGFAAAFVFRLRSLSAFGIRSTNRRWIAIGAALGLVSFVAKGVAILAYSSLIGDDRTIQDIYATGASGGAWTVLLATFFLSVVTPIGEEFLFRGVVTTALLRYGAFIGVAGGAVIFALFHGINMVLPAAFITGVAAGEVFRRSGSIWPAILVHAVVNLPTIPIMVLAKGVS